jgi:hypothetical protein
MVSERSLRFCAALVLRCWRPFVFVWLALGATTEAAHAWTLTLNAAPRRVFLQVGNGQLNTNNASVNLVSVTVPALLLGNGTAQAMTSDSTQSRSPLDNYLVCTPPMQVYVGGSYQRSNGSDGPASAVLQVTSQANLVSSTGNTIPFSEIAWSVGSLGNDATPNVIPAGTFTGGTQLLASVPANRFLENCHSFRYANAVARAAGTYNGQVTYTLATP